MMSTLDIFVEKGVEKGKRVGVENMLLEGYGAELICKLMAVSPEFVERVREEINK